jgi:hypothetical protein
MVYNYFADNFGHTEKIPDKALVDKYGDQTVKELKKSLKKLKLSSAEPREIKFVSRTLREKLRNASQNNLDDQTTQNDNEVFNHDNYIGRNLWGYVKNILNKNTSVLPTFSMIECLTYFKRTLSAIKGHWQQKFYCLYLLQ